MLKDITSYTAYRHYLEDAFSAAPKQGHGIRLKLAAHLRVHTSYLSQVLGGQKDFNSEQGLGVAEFFALSEEETRYFLLMIQWARAGTQKLKQHLDSQMKEHQKRHQDLAHRLKHAQALSDQEQSLFYSAWFYSGIRLATGVSSLRTPEALSEYFGLPVKVVKKTLEFLLSHGLVTMTPRGYQRAAKSLHLSKDSPHVSKHHHNWRLKALTALPGISDQELMFSAPMVVAEKDLSTIRAKLLALVDQISKDIHDSKEETLACLNIDWFKF